MATSTVTVTDTDTDTNKQNRVTTKKDTISLVNLITKEINYLNDQCTAKIKVPIPATLTATTTDTYYKDLQNLLVTFDIFKKQTDSDNNNAIINLYELQYFLSNAVLNELIINNNIFTRVSESLYNYAGEANDNYIKRLKLLLITKQLHILIQIYTNANVLTKTTLASPKADTLIILTNLKTLINPNIINVDHNNDINYEQISLYLSILCFNETKPAGA